MAFKWKLLIAYLTLNWSVAMSESESQLSLVSRRSLPIMISPFLLYRKNRGSEENFHKMSMASSATTQHATYNIKRGFTEHANLKLYTSQTIGSYAC